MRGAKENPRQKGFPLRIENMYTKVVVPLDGSKLAEQILPYARSFAEAYVIAVELLHIRDPEIRPPFWPPLPGREYLKETAPRFFPTSAPIDYLEEDGKPASVIVDRAKRDPACLIAMATHGLSGTRRWLLGSVASKVVQTAVNPLLLIRPVEADKPESKIRLKTVFVPLDGSPLAETILPHVVALAKKMQLDVHVVRVCRLPLESYVVGDGTYVDEVDEHKAAMQKEIETYLEGTKEKLRAEGVNRVVSTMLEGDPAGEIIDLAKKTPDNLVAMSTHGRSGVGRWVLGSVTEKVVQNSRDPVLVVRPE
jgi:nucleotide-binding universal stress UspA family protein